MNFSSLLTYALSLIFVIVMPCIVLLNLYLFPYLLTAVLCIILLRFVIVMIRIVFEEIFKFNKRKGN